MSNTRRKGGDAPTYRTVAALLDSYRHRDSAKPAIVEVDERRSIAFGELADAVDRAALELAHRGVRNGVRVVLIAETSIECLVLWFAVWRAGGVVCPLDFSFMRSSGSCVLDALSPHLILTDDRRDLAAVLPAVSTRVARYHRWQHGTNTVPIDDDQALPVASRFIVNEADVSALPSPSIDDLACIACTSGTTGVPKMVVYDHRSYWENGQDSIALTDLGANDRMLEYRSFGWYSAQILSLMPFLQTGLTLHLARKFSFRNFPRWIEAHRITVCVGVPPVINMLVDASDPPDAQRFASLRVMTSSTAPLTTVHWIRFEERYGIRLLNLYGSSEAGWICGNRDDARRIGTVGRPLPDIELTVASESGEPLPAGIPGLARVESGKLAVGYLEADGTIQPVRGRPLMLKDVVVRDDEGFVRILGRTDDLIIRGGIKVSPAEIEDVLLAHAAVMEAAAIGVPDPVYGQQVVAFIVLRPNHHVKPEEILAHCAARLPREKVPVRTIVVASLPTSPRGKLLRNKLLTNYQADAANARERAAAASR